MQEKLALFKETIKAYTPLGKEEADVKENLLRDLDAYQEKLFYREKEDVHLTASALLFDMTGENILLIYHPILKTYAWVGGHADGVVDLLSVALKEAKEETGLSRIYPLSEKIASMTCLPVPAHVKNDMPVAAHNHYNITYMLVADKTEKIKFAAREVSDAKWFSVSEMHEYVAEQKILPVYQGIIDEAQRIFSKRKEKYTLLPKKLLPWYQANKRALPWRKTKDPYAIWISEIMLQQTRVEAVKRYYTRFMKELPDIAALAAVSQERLNKLWEGLGYYTRARNLKRAAEIIEQQHGGVFPREYKEISALPGIGPYTAGAVSSIAFQEKTPAVDGNVLRILARIMGYYISIDENFFKNHVTNMLRAEYPTKAGLFTQSLMELGAIVCLPNGAPFCKACPMQRICYAYKHNAQEVLPLRTPKRKRKIENRTVFLLQCEDRIAIQKRPEKGLLAGLYEFPNVPGVLSLEEIIAQAEAWGAAPRRVEKIVHEKHIFTHIEWHMQGIYILCEDMPKEFNWVKKEKLIAEHALPSAFQMFLARL